VGLSAENRGFLDLLARSVVLARAGAALVVQDDGRWSWWGPCERCKRTQWLNWCHVFTRASYSVRWDLDNAFGWCDGCHRHLDQHWEEKRDWAISRVGESAFEALKVRSRPGRRPDYEAVRLYLVAAWTPLSRGLPAEARDRFRRRLR
jgi:hypothetical protein